MFLTTLAKHVNNNSLVNLAALSTVEKSPFFKPFPFSLPLPSARIQNTHFVSAEYLGKWKSALPLSLSRTHFLPSPSPTRPDEGGREEEEGDGGEKDIVGPCTECLCNLQGDAVRERFNFSMVFYDFSLGFNFQLSSHAIFKMWW